MLVALKVIFYPAFIRKQMKLIGNMCRLLSLRLSPSRLVFLLGKVAAIFPQMICFKSSRVRAWASSPLCKVKRPIIRKTIKEGKVQQKEPEKFNSPALRFYLLHSSVPGLNMYAHCLV